MGACNFTCCSQLIHSPTHSLTHSTHSLNTLTHSLTEHKQDQYANYVIQKTLQLAPRDAALMLVESIRQHLVLMRNSSGGRRMLTKIAKRFPVRARAWGGGEMK